MNPIIAAGEMTILSIGAEEGDAGFPVAEAIGLAYEDFSVTVRYADASGRPRGELRLDVKSGQNPYVKNREWSQSTTSAIGEVVGDTPGSE